MRALILTVILAVVAGTGSKLFAQDITPEEAQKRVEERARQIEEAKTRNEKLREYSKHDTPSEREARKELQKEADHRKNEERKNRSALVNAAVTGCDAGGVTVNPRATGSYSAQSYVKVRVTNLHTFPITIDDESGTVVRNLCGGGSVTLFRSRNMWVDGTYYTFHYTARGQFPDGTLGIAQSQQWQLSSYDVSSGQSQRFDSWEVRLQKAQW